MIWPQNPNFFKYSLVLHTARHCFLKTGAILSVYFGLIIQWKFFHFRNMRIYMCRHYRFCRTVFRMWRACRYFTKCNGMCFLFHLSKCIQLYASIYLPESLPVASRLTFIYGYFSHIKRWNSFCFVLAHSNVWRITETSCICCWIRYPWSPTTCSKNLFTN